MEVPNIGSIVHFYFDKDGLDGKKGDPVKPDAIPVPGMVTRVNLDGSIELTVFEPGKSPQPISSISKTKDKIAGSWRWPDPTKTIP